MNGLVDTHAHLDQMPDPALPSASGELVQTEALKSRYSYIWKMLIVISVLYLLFMASLGWFAFPNEDDYVYEYQLDRLGWLNLEKDFYFKWSGRYVANMAVPMISRHDRLWTYHAHPAALLAALIGLLYLIWREVADSNTRIRSAALALFTGMCLITSFQALNECLYFVSGASVYFWGMLLNIAAVWLLIRQVKKQKPLFFDTIALAVILFLNAGTNEVSALVMFFLIWVLAVRALAQRLSRHRSLVFFGLLSLLCLSLSFFAPGNFYRLSAQTGTNRDVAADAQPGLYFGPYQSGETAARPPMVARLLNAVVPALDELQKNTVQWIFVRPFIWLMLIAVPLVRPRGNWKIVPKMSLRGNIIISALLLFGLVFACFLMTLGATGSVPARTRAAVQFAFYGGSLYMMILSTATLEAWKKRLLRSRGCCVVVAIALVLLTVTQYNVYLPVMNLSNGDLSAFRAGYLERHRQSAAAHGRDLALPALPAYPYPVFYRELESKPTHWANMWYAEVWNLKSVVIE